MYMQTELFSRIEYKRKELVSTLDSDSKSSNGQFMTPLPIARAMADMFSLEQPGQIRLLDPGAGIGALTLAFLEVLAEKPKPFPSIEAHLYESDPFLAGELRSYSNQAMKDFKSEGLDVKIEVFQADFIDSAVEILKPSLESRSSRFRPFTHVIANPPYRKIRSSSREKSQLSSVGISANNLYSAFVGLSLLLLSQDGELVAITPRSFCNGPYFKPFRKLLLSEASFKHIHLFERRDEAFSEESVLQENVIYHLEKGASKNGVTLSKSSGRYFDSATNRTVNHSQIVHPSDPECVVRIPANEFDDFVLDRVSVLPHQLADFGLEVSTGPVVDFRVRDYIHDAPGNGRVPLIYPAHLQNQSVSWPGDSEKKPNSIQINPSTRKWLFPNQYYVLVKRFSSKEERRRLYPAAFSPIDNFGFIGFENHLNVIHSSGTGIDKKLCLGLVAYLSSTIADLYFRQFSGHTQVNATDLRSFPFPSEGILFEIAELQDGVKFPTAIIDEYLEQFFRSQFGITTPNPVEIKRNES
jgi:adenine-specific DNA-methyltransferase